MSNARRDIVNVADIPTQVLHTGPRFEAAWGQIGPLLGLTHISAALHIVPVRKTAWPYHRHHGRDELFVILAGTGEYRVGERRLPIRAGDCVGAPAGGEAHQIINTGDVELRYLAIDNRSRADVIEYPDSGKIAVGIAHGEAREPESALEFEGRFTPVAGYWDGEDMEGER